MRFMLLDRHKRSFWLSREFPIKRSALQYSIYFLHSCTDFFHRQESLHDRTKMSRISTCTSVYSNAEDQVKTYLSKSPVTGNEPFLFIREQFFVGSMLIHPLSNQKRASAGRSLQAGAAGTSQFDSPSGPFVTTLPATHLRRTAA